MFPNWKIQGRFVPSNIVSRNKVIRVVGYSDNIYNQWKFATSTKSSLKMSNSGCGIKKFISISLLNMYALSSWIIGCTVLERDEL